MNYRLKKEVSYEKKDYSSDVYNKEIDIGPGTAGLAMKMDLNNEKEQLSILEKNIVLRCKVNQY